MQTGSVRRESSDGEGGAARPMAEVRPRLRHDVLFADTGEGVLLRHANASFVIKGRSAYRFFTAIAPHLTGGTTVAELSEAVPPQGRQMLSSLVSSLLERGFARDVRRFSQTELDTAVQARFEGQVRYIEHYVDGGLDRFARFRNLEILVVGQDSVAEWAAVALVRNGAGHVEVSRAVPRSGRLADEARELEIAGCRPEVTSTDLTLANMSGADLAGYDLVLASGSEHDAPHVWRLCKAGGLPDVIPAVVLGDHAIIGPRHSGDSCWNCALLRYTEAADAATAARVWRRFGVDSGASAAVQPAGPQAAMVGNALAFEAFRWATGALEGETESAAVVQDLRTLDGSSERVLPHPACPRRHSVMARMGADGLAAADLIPEPQDDAAVDDAYRTAEPMIGARMGLVDGFLDMDLPQSPLKVSRVRISGHTETGVARGDVHTTLRARLRTLRAAALLYVDAKAVPSGGSGATVVDAERIGTFTGIAQEAPPRFTVPGSVLYSGGSYEVPFAAAHPFSALNKDGVFEHSSAGGGVGSTLAQAAHAGLFSAVAYDALRRAAAGAPADRLSFGSPTADTDLGFLTRVLSTLGEHVEAFRLPGTAPVSLVRTAEGTRWAIGSGGTLAEALTCALRDLVAAVQLADTGVPAPEPLVPWLEAFDPRAVTVGAGAAVIDPDALPCTAEDVCAQLWAVGKEAVVVPTSTSDLADHCGMITVRVLLVDRDGPAGRGLADA